MEFGSMLGVEGGEWMLGDWGEFWGGFAGVFGGGGGLLKGEGRCWIFAEEGGENSELSHALSLILSTGKGGEGEGWMLVLLGGLAGSSASSGFKSTDADEDCC